MWKIGFKFGAAYIGTGERARLKGEREKRGCARKAEVGRAVEVRGRNLCHLLEEDEEG